MTTGASSQIRAYAAAWDASLPTAVLSGIIGDKAHLAGGGYHISIEDNRPGNYSVVRPLDAAPPGKWSRKDASAVDMSMGKTDQVTCWNRVFAVWVDHTDPRRRYFNAINGWNGVGEPERLDFIANTRKITTRDHWTHTHDETPRCFHNDAFAFDAKLSVWRGETKAAYVARISGGGEMAGDAASNADQANWWGGASMGPAVPSQYRALRLPAASPVDDQGYYGNDQNSRLYYIQRMLEDLGRAMGVVSTGDQVAALVQLVQDLSQRPAVVLDEAVAQTIANKITALGGGATPEEVRAIIVEELDNERRDEAGRLLGPNSTVNSAADVTEVGPMEGGQTAEERAAAETSQKAKAKEDK